MAKKKRVRRTPKPESELEALFYKSWVSNYPRHRPAVEYRFHPSRKFRFDFAWVEQKVAVEVQGMGPGHCSLQGMTQDYDKLMEALLFNWKVIYLTSSMLSTKNIDYNFQRIAKLLRISSPPEKPRGYVPLRYRK